MTYLANVVRIVFELVKTDIKISYNVTIIPEVDIELWSDSEDAHIVQFVLSYNTEYSVNIVKSICGQDVGSINVPLNYGKND